MTNTTQKCTNKQFILRTLNTQFPLTVSKLIALFKKDGITILVATVEQILDELYKLQIVEYYELNDSVFLGWETNNIWENYLSESRRQDLMGYFQLPKIVKISIAHTDLNKNSLIKYNGNLYNNIEQINNHITLQLLTLEEENKVRKNRNTPMYIIGT